MKQSVRDFLLSLVVSVVIFAVAAFFLIAAAEGLMSDVVGGVRDPHAKQSSSVVQQTAEESEDGDKNATDSRVVSMLFVLMDDDHHADAIFLLGVNPEKESSTMVMIPSNTVVSGAVTSCLGDLDAERQSGTLMKVVQEQVGINPKYYAAISRDGFANWVDFMGGISFRVPQNMEDFDEASNRRISLKEGDQQLSGDQVAQFLAYTNYVGGSAARDNAILDFARAFSKAFLTPANLNNARNIYYNVSRHMFTTFEEKDFATSGPSLFRFNEFSPNIKRIDGSAGASGYVISTERVKPTFEIYQ